MDKRTLFALLLMFLLFLVFDHFVWKPQRERQQAQKNLQTETQAPVRESATTDSIPSQPAISQAAPADSVFLQNTIEEETLYLENDLVKVSFSSRGAVIKQVELKKFKMRKGGNVLLIPVKDQDSSLAGLKIFHGAGVTDLSGLLFEHQQFGADSLVFSLQSNPSEGASREVLSKSYSLGKDYDLRLNYIIEALADNQPIYGAELDFGMGIAETEQNLKTKAQDYKFMLYSNQLISRKTMNNLKKSRAAFTPSSFDFAALKSKYFTLAIQELPPASTQNVVAFHNPDTESPAFYIDSKRRDARMRWEQNFRLYLGPIDFNVLEQYGLEKIAERGKWLGWLAKIIAAILRFLHSIIPNYGLVIIIFSILLKIVLHPITHKQLNAGIKMQKIQPQLRAIQQQYKNDLVKLRQEHSALFK
ncbi:MAG: membrane protein insertase YidC, partial [Candidatus Cloacimonetes bacterium]|nr:membrane protein insertase YidC [Candidatus Cloacimonadota bacterium]